MATAQVTMKSACDACTASRVKCGGEDPCARCVKKGITCFYSPKKQRGPQKKRDRSNTSTLAAEIPVGTFVSTSAVMSRPAATTMGLHERRSWSVFFTLYKHYGVFCSVYWFNRQLLKMRLFLQTNGDIDSLKRLNSWMGALNIDPDVLSVKVTECEQTQLSRAKLNEELLKAKGEHQSTINWDLEIAKILNRGSGPYWLQIPGKIVGESVPSATNQSNGPVSLESQDPFVVAKFTESEEASYECANAAVQFELDHRDPFAEMHLVCNKAFEDLFGYGAKEIGADFAKSGGGFLPWGADIISRMVPEESDLLGFVQILAIKFNTLGRPKTIPIIRRVPSVHVFNIQQKGYNEVGTVEAVIKMVHTEVVTRDFVKMHVSMTITPTEALPTEPLETVESDAMLVRKEAVELLPPKRIKTKNEPAIYNHKAFLADHARLSAQKEASSEVINAAEQRPELKAQAPPPPPQLAPSGYGIPIGQQGEPWAGIPYSTDNSLSGGAYLTSNTVHDESAHISAESSISSTSDRMASENESWLQDLLEWTGPAKPLPIEELHGAFNDPSFQDGPKRREKPNPTGPSFQLS